jgi:aspartyl-tRNA(Asn)/glutamyl-tRNA(Gln) amidotransferase subunit C
MINNELVHHIAKLARLKLSEEDAANFTNQLSSILEYVEQLNAVNTENVLPTNFMAPEHDPLRDDIIIASLTHDKILQNGPSVKKEHFAIPKVIGD